MCVSSNPAHLYPMNIDMNGKRGRGKRERMAREGDGRERERGGRVIGKELFFLLLVGFFC